MGRLDIVAAAQSSLDWIRDSVVLRLASRASILVVVLLGTTIGGTAAGGHPTTAAAIPSGCDLPLPIQLDCHQQYSRLFGLMVTKSKVPE